MEELAETATKQIPYGLVLLSVYLGFIVSFLVIIEIALRFWRSPSLELSITRELFLRILATGESLYINCIFVAYDCGALIQKITASLEKTNDPAKKKFKLRVAQTGEKQRIEGKGFEWYFYSSSPKCYVPENNMQRMVYVCEYESYADLTRQAFLEFSREIEEIIKAYQVYPNIGDDKEIVMKFAADTKPIINKATTKVIDNLQIEPGNYKLCITIHYRQKYKFLPISINKSTTSNLTFVVEENARDYLRNTLENTLNQSVYKLLIKDFTPAPVTQYTPIKIRESE